ncbi:matrix metalloproteinase-16 isoform X1 [Melanaphis sacchari]|uniref:matrix metalloproteinase-16 isoform X1 n=1 Tax=Melanaphis sacchari TaxID=742174 RepID=UPI000DC14366|nr:matrix metalloproteinase-16 isoform X1 [Melanaphis sacchari]
MTTCKSCIVLMSSLVLLSCTPRSAVAVQTDAQAMMYLSQFGYLSPSMKNPNSGHIMSEETMARALMEFQSFVGLNLTGHLDDETLHYMSMPRCGVRDKVGFATDSRSRRYALQGSRWRVKDLTYKISKYPKLLGKSETDSEIRKAFDVWSEVTPLTFTHKKSGQVHIEIRFEKGEHGDGDPFDGPGGTLAHAFFPVYGGDAHFDDSEKWSIGSFKGTNLFQVAAHEFGHSLGLSHSDVRSALMAPFYRGYNPSFSLDSDDIEAIQALYGANSASEGSDNDDDSTGQGSGKKTTTQEPPGAEGSDAELCTDTKVNALFNSANGETFVFKGDYYWKLTDDGLAQGFPKPIAGTWSGLPGNIDAAFTYKNGKTYFFKGTKYWKYTDTTMDDGYPKDIAEGFAGIPDNIDAALVWSGNGKIYFFKGSKFWKFDPMQKPPVKSTYPKPISNWDGIPDNIDAALHYTNGYTYFFKDENYYRFNDRTFAVDIADPPFPRNAGYWWFGCRAENKGHRKEMTAVPSILRPTWMEVRRDHKGNQNTDVGDLILDADNSRKFNETQLRFDRSSSSKHTVTTLCIILTSLWWCIS